MGNNKAYAAILAGAFSTAFVFFWNTFLPSHPLPQGMDGTLQTIFTAVAVYITPHGGQA